MPLLGPICLKLLRWTGWLLLPLLLAFLATGYAMSGRYGLAAFVSEQSALALHKLLHLPLAILLVGHVVPSVVLWLLRHQWIKPRPPS